MSDWRTPWKAALEATRGAYGSAIGRPVDELPTPALVVDVDALDRNIATMTDALRGAPAVLRPHTKVQKSPELAQRQLRAGAVGVTVATVWEAAAMAAAGVDDILIANEFVGAAQIRAFAALARRARLTVAVDDASNVAELAEALTASGARAWALVDLDVGMRRCGVRSTEDGLALGRAIASVDGLDLVGVQAYEGHCMHEPDRARRARMAHQAMDEAAELRALLLADGHTAHVLSGGGTGTFDVTGRHPAVTELQAGSFVFMDAFHGDLVPDFERSLTVHATVSSRHGDTVILDTGRKSIGIDFVLPTIWGRDYVARYFAEEHALFDTDPAFAASPGDRVRLVPGYAPTTVNLHDVYFVASGDEVVDVWTVFPRGPSHHGFVGALSREA